MVDDITLLQHAGSEALPWSGHWWGVGEVGPDVFGGGPHFDDAGLPQADQSVEVTLNLCGDHRIYKKEVTLSLHKDCV